jgi:hypothetical protein
MNGHWFSTLERLKKKNINRLISVADMRVARSVFWRLERVREGKAPPSERFSFSDFNSSNIYYDEFDIGHTAVLRT